MFLYANVKNWDGERKRRPVIDAAFNLDFSTLRPHKMFDDGQAKPRASQFARPGFVHTIESLEDSRQIVRGNTDARITHLDPDSRASLARRVGNCCDLNASALRGVFD